jgi:exodeoxyribonuclease I
MYYKGFKLHSTSTYIYYDFETLGKDPKVTRACQFGGVITDSDLNIIDKPIELYCQSAADCVPHPEAFAVHGILPSKIREEGLTEVEFTRKIFKLFNVSGRTNIGFNSIEFDNEIQRFQCYRNFFDPYQHEWKDARKADVLNIFRLAYCVAPEVMQWPRLDGRTSFKLEALAAENGFDVSQSHDALCDVYNTIGLHKLIKSANPKLFDFTMSLSDKQRVKSFINQQKHFLMVSPYFGSDCNYIKPVKFLCWGKNSNHAYCIDLSSDIASFNYDQAIIDTSDCFPRTPIIKIEINKHPMLAALSLIRRDNNNIPYKEENISQMIQVVDDELTDKAVTLARGLFEGDFTASSQNPDTMLYNGFPERFDQYLIQGIHSDDVLYNIEKTRFKSPQLNELLFRFKCRNFPEALTEQEKGKWNSYLKASITGQAGKVNATVDEFKASLDAVIGEGRIEANSTLHKELLDILGTYHKILQG